MKESVLTVFQRKSPVQSSPVHILPIAAQLLPLLVSSEENLTCNLRLRALAQVGPPSTLHRKQVHTQTKDGILHP